MRPLALLWAFPFVLLACCCLTAHSQPNIVHIFADDLGWGSVGFNGQSLIQTPNLDALAAGGMKFDRAYAATVCGPSRAMLYLGYHNGHTLVDRNGNLSGDAFRADGQTVGDHLQSAGYSTAVFGKWGFGGTNPGGNDLRPNPTVDGPNSVPTAQGFQNFYGYLNHGRAHSYRVDSLWTTTEPFDDNGNGIDEVGEKYASQPATGLGLWLEKTGNNSANFNTNYTADLVRQKSLQYIEQQANSGQPFYMQYASTIPHFDIDSIRNFPGWFDAYGNANVPGSDSWTNDQKSYAAMITLLDLAVGEIVAKLRDPDGDGDQSDSIIEDTLIMFSSDNGATAEDSSPINFFNASGGKRGGKRDLWDGGINVPTLAYWEGTIAGGQTSNRYTDLADFMPTALELAGVEARVGIDGVSLAHELTGQGIDRKRDYIVHEHHGGDGPDSDGRDPRWAIIRDEIKLIKFSNGDLELYDLATDFDENSPLSFGNPANAALRDELQAIALAEGVEQGDSYTVEFQDWTGSVNDDLTDAGNWTGTATSIATPDTRWSAVINNTSATESELSTDVSTSFLGLEVRGDGARQTVRSNRHTTLTGRNEMRISGGGRINLDDATLSTVRWVDIKQGGELTGHGQVDGDTYNWGKISPGLPADMSQPSDPPEPPGIPDGVDTGVVAAIEFDFTGIQDDAPLTQTSQLNQYLQLTGGLDFGPGVSPRNAADAGNEFNIQGFQSGNTVSSAINADDYLTYTVEPVFGIEMLVDELNFTYWRNGDNAARQFGILTSIDGFSAGQELATSIVHGISDTATYVLTGQYTGGQWVQEPVEVRFYGWNANTNNGNTHVNQVDMTASFRTISAQQAITFDFAGQGDGQDEAPLVATSELNESLQLVSGLDLGTGLSFKGASEGTDNGNEFNVKDWSVGTTLADAIAADDYLTYTVQPIAGIEMDVREVSFELWRNGENAADSYAIMTSLDGFTAGNELGQLGPVVKNDGSSADPSDLIGFDARTDFTVDTGGGVWTSDPVEVRLYGWGANQPAGNTHITGAAMTGFFRTNGGPSVALNPTGELTLKGDFFHVESGMIEMELGGDSLADPLDPEYDRLIVTGAAEIAGALTVSLVDGFLPTADDVFDLFDFASVTGTFESINLPSLTGGLVWDTSELLVDGTLAVVATGDFNDDGEINGLDFLAWQRGETPNPFSQSDLSLWESGYGTSSSVANAAVPEPSSVVILLATGLLLSSSRYRKR